MECQICSAQKGPKTENGKSVTVDGLHQRIFLIKRRDSSVTSSLDDRV
ncbi:hypothetical protein AVEN_1200-1, partial [Araneus ventricosus]